MQSFTELTREEAVALDGGFWDPAWVVAQVIAIAQAFAVVNEY